MNGWVKYDIIMMLINGSLFGYNAYRRRFCPYPDIARWYRIGMAGAAVGFVGAVVGYVFNVG